MALIRVITAGVLGVGCIDVIGEGCIDPLFRTWLRLAALTPSAVQRAFNLALLQYFEHSLIRPCKVHRRERSVVVQLRCVAKIHVNIF